MIPVPETCLNKLVIKDMSDEKYKILLNKEFRFCIDNAKQIQKKHIKYTKWL